MKIIVSIILMLLSIYAYTQDIDCANVKTGKFKYALKERPELLIRTGSTQIEINPITKVEIYSSIKWVSDCEYVMTYEKILNYPEDVKHMIGQKINVKIIAAFNNGYVVHAKSSRIDNVIEFVLAE